MYQKPNYEMMECQECQKQIEKRPGRKYCSACSNKLHKERMRIAGKEKRLKFDKYYQKDKRIQANIKDGINLCFY